MYTAVQHIGQMLRSYKGFECTYMLSRIGNINVRDKSSHSETSMCKLLYNNVKADKSYRPDTNLHRPSRSDSYIPPTPL